jgi:hypothetical protein
VVVWAGCALVVVVGVVADLGGTEVVLLRGDNVLALREAVDSVDKELRDAMDWADKELRDATDIVDCEYHMY